VNFALKKTWQKEINYFFDFRPEYQEEVLKIQ
jgi:hypothetical protein